MVAQHAGHQGQAVSRWPASLIAAGKLRLLLTHRKLLQSKAIAIDNDLRGMLRNFGLKVGMVGTVRFEARIKELVENPPDVAALVEPLLVVQRTLREQFCILHRRLLAIVRGDEVCRLQRHHRGGRRGLDRGPAVASGSRARPERLGRHRRARRLPATLEVTLPWLLAKFAERVVPTIRKEARLMLEKK
jgi:transposase